MARAGRAGARGPAPSRTRSVSRRSHVQFQRQDREAQWREARRVRVRHLPGETRGPGARPGGRWGRRRPRRVAEVAPAPPLGPAGAGDELRPQGPAAGAQHHGGQGEGPGSPEGLSRPVCSPHAGTLQGRAWAYPCGGGLAVPRARVHPWALRVQVMRGFQQLRCWGAWSLQSGASPSLEATSSQLPAVDCSCAALRPAVPATCEAGVRAQGWGPRDGCKVS